MNYEEMEAKIKEEKAKLAILEDAYEKETEEVKYQKIEYTIDRKQEAINRLIDRQDALIDKENKEEANNGKDKDKDDEEDETVCPTCGSDLYEDGDFLYCEKCNEYFEVVEDE